MFPKTILWRHRRENLRKCSLEPLKGRSDLLFCTYPTDPLPDLRGYVLLKVGAPPLTEADREKGLFLIDATWRLAYGMEKSLPVPIEERSLPGFPKTAYPRRQTECPDPEVGLASIEALYLAYRVMNRDIEGLLDSYYWRKPFLEKNPL